MLEATFAVLDTARPNLAGDLDEGVLGLLLPPDLTAVTVGRPDPALVACLHPYVREVREGAESDRTPVGTERGGDPTALLVIAGREVPRAELRRVVPDGAHVFEEIGARRPRRRADHELLLEIDRGRVVAATPAADPPPVRVPWHELRPDRRSARRVVAEARRRRTARRDIVWAVLSIRGGDATLVPGHLRATLGADGLDVTGERVTIEDRATYRTQKVVARIGTSATPTAVLKVVRDPADGHRLRNEARVLRHLAELADLADLVPRVAAAGELSGRPYLAQPFVEGALLIDLLRTASEDPSSPAEPGFDAVVDFLAELATATRGTGDDAPAALGRLVAQFVDVVAPPAEIADRLAADVAALSSQPKPLPSVLMHGDLGTWNIRVAPDGRPLLLDWEAGELRGVPLWDLFYLFRNRAFSPVAARPGDLVGPCLLDDPVLAPRLRDAVRRIAGRIDLPTTLVPALFRLCWVHRAVKESTRRRTADPDHGYAQLAIAVAAMDEADLYTRLVGT